VAVTGTFWQAVQPVSVASLPLPVGAATDASVVSIDTDLNLRMAESRRILEMQYLLSYQNTMAALDPSRGFELK
jgi:hypothetical protein